MADVLILGNGVVANLTAAFVKLKHPDLDVQIVGLNDSRRPIVGESLVEISAHFMVELGLSDVLIREHVPKYGLTFYYKAALDDPGDRRYVVDEAPALPPLPAFQLNRFTFDARLRELNRERGVKLLEGKITEVAPGEGGAPHRVTVETGEGKQTVSGRWLVDASGRTRLLAKKLGLGTPAPVQRSAFWFRLAGFEPNFLDRMEPIKKQNHAYDSYFATHHFFGRANWIWAIPMRSPDARNLISIGITYRPDLYPGEVTTFEAFMDRVGREHPILTDMIKTGEVVDTAVYRNYMYTTRQHYSPDRWFIVGDAGDTVDPLYSVGLALASVQIRQVSALIGYDRRGQFTEELVRDLDRAYTGMHRVTAAEVTDLYPVMHDPFKCHMRQHLSVLAQFHLAAPMVAVDYPCDPIGAKLLAAMGDPDRARKQLHTIRELINKVGDRIDRFSPGDYLKVQSADSMNWPFFEYLREEDLPGGIAKMVRYMAGLKLKLLLKAGPRAWLDPKAVAEIAGELVASSAVERLFGGKRLRDSAALRLLLRKAEPMAGDATNVIPMPTHAGERESSTGTGRSTAS